MKKTLNLLFSSLLLSVCLNVTAGGIFRFDNQSTTGSAWEDGHNWRVQSAGDIKGCLPGAEDTVRFNFGGATGCLSSDAGTVYKLQIGSDDKGGTLILNPGAKLVVNDQENYIGWNGIGEGGALIVNGGMLEYNGWVSVANEGKGTFILNDGTVRVVNVFYHNLRNGGGRSFSQVRGGVLDVNSMTLNSGILDISGGLVRIRAKCSDELVKEWVKRGLITFNGRTGAIEGIDYALSVWGSEGVEITPVTPPDTLDLIYY